MSLDWTYAANNDTEVVQEASVSSLVAPVVSRSMTLLQQYPLQSGNFIELAIVFAVLAIVAAAVGASGVAGISMTVAKWLIIIFILLAVVSFVL